MDMSAAIRAAASDAPETAIAALRQVEAEVRHQGALDTPLRAAHLIGQCAHESVRFTRVSESLFYTSRERLLQVFGRHFRDAAQAEAFLRDPERLANHVYANRMGNGPAESGDGFRYRGRGYLQLTGRETYRKFGASLDLDLEGEPERAAEPTTAWQIAARYLASRRRDGKTALEWADEDNVEAVTRIVNGGLNGLEDRRDRTARALIVLEGRQTLPTVRRNDEGHIVELLQRTLALRGFSPGAVDGDFGPKTERAVQDFQTARGLAATGVVETGAWTALAPLPF